MRITTQCRVAFRVKSFKAAVIRGKWLGGGRGGGGEEVVVGGHWWTIHVAEMLSWGGGGGEGGGVVRVELWPGVVPRERKSGESVSLGVGHRGTGWSSACCFSMRFVLPTLHAPSPLFPIRKARFVLDTVWLVIFSLLGN